MEKIFDPRHLSAGDYAYLVVDGKPVEGVLRCDQGRRGKLAIGEGENLTLVRTTYGVMNPGVILRYAERDVEGQIRTVIGENLAELLALHNGIAGAPVPYQGGDATDHLKSVELEAFIEGLNHALRIVTGQQ